MALALRARWLAAAALVVMVLGGAAPAADKAGTAPQNHCARAHADPAADLALRRAMWLPVGAA